MVLSSSIADCSRIAQGCISTRRNTLAAMVLMLTCCLYVPGMLAAQSEDGNAPNSQVTVTITSSNAPGAQKKFRVVLLCDTYESRTKGLQGFRPLAKDEAALFVFEPPATVTFWMGSVSFPIDIIFVGPDKRVVKVYENCNPGSQDLYPSVKQAKWVIETAAGSGVKAGDRVRF